jgi:hypothetical protein
VRNDVALAILAGSIENSEYGSIRTIQSAAEAWIRLQDIYQPDGEQAYYRAMTQLMNLSYGNSGSIQEASQKLDNLWKEMEDVEHEDPKERKRQLKICLLLNLLPKEFDYIVANMQSILDLTYNEAVKRLRHEEL